MKISVHLIRPISATFLGLALAISGFTALIAEGQPIQGLSTLVSINVNPASPERVQLLVSASRRNGDPKRTSAISDGQRELPVIACAPRFFTSDGNELFVDSPSDLSVDAPSVTASADQLISPKTLQTVGFGNWTVSASIYSGEVEVWFNFNDGSVPISLSPRIQLGDDGRLTLRAVLVCSGVPANWNMSLSQIVFASDTGETRAALGNNSNNNFVSNCYYNQAGGYECLSADVYLR